jgi:hypothetical protein
MSEEILLTDAVQRLTPEDLENLPIMATFLPPFGGPSIDGSVTANLYNGQWKFEPDHPDDPWFGVDPSELVER